MSSSLRIWSNVQCPDALSNLLRQRVAPHQLLFSPKVEASVLVAGGADPSINEADIAFGQPDPQSVLKAPKLKWVHLTSAGYTRYDNESFRAGAKKRGLMVTNSSSVYAEPCAQHLLALMMSLARQLPVAMKNQLTEHGWPYFPCRSSSVLLNGQTALLVGYGAIGARLAELLAPLQMNVIGIRRTPRGNESVPIKTFKDLDALLPQADHVINILPAAEGTANFFATDRFSKLKSSAIFYNIGRGDTVDQEALRDALLAKKFRAAYLDVTTPEPLPPDHPLWTTPNCCITTHTAGGHSNELERLVNHFLNNLTKYNQSESLRDRIM
ncbi:MAG TPA: D-2-hydroxyacid dehydrogenase [Tepidisphaeraceae bacterium]|jgi:phosphoglycerate dehydrogenase-like enzyme|nr:D-2-hydroxyacid dehydrogenase [Tepidisphaeraceae bacterium]